MAIANNVPFSTRRVQDATTLVSFRLPTANNTTVLNSAAIALYPIFGTAGAYPVTEKFLCSVSLPATTSTTNSKNVNVWLQHTSANSDNTANGAAWANVPFLSVPVCQVTDAAGTSAANVSNFMLPPDKILNFIRAQFVGEANGGDYSGGNGTLTLLF